MGRDHSRVQINHWESIAGIPVPVDAYGHYLNRFAVSDDGQEALTLTDPYGVLEYAVGNSEEDETCDGDYTTFFDFGELPDGRIILHSVVNTDSGGYIGDGEYVVVEPQDAYLKAMEMVNDAEESLYYNEVYHDAEGWNQSPCYFARCVRAWVEKDRFFDVPRHLEEACKD